MSRRARACAVLGAALLLVLGAVPLSRAADRLLPDAIRLWDTDQCAPSDTTDHALFGMGAAVLTTGHPDVQILDARPLGLSEGAGWRTWIVPVATDGGWTGSLGTLEPPPGWPDRTAASGANVSGDRRAQLLLEVWPGRSEARTAVRGFLVTYRTAFGIVRTVRTPTTLTTRVGGCA